MAKRRKLAQKSTPTSNSESEPLSQPQPESETQSQPESTPEPIEEDQPSEAAAKEAEEESGEESESEHEEEEEESKDQKPQTRKTPNPNPNPNEEGFESNPESIQKHIDVLPKEQLINLLTIAAAKHSDVLAEIHRVADVDVTQRKIFVHGLGWDTTSQTLTSFFSQYGEIEDCKAVIDKVTGKSKGYAFILFKHRKGAQNALKEPQKKIGGRMTACQLASMGPVPPPVPPESEYTQRKIFVSNVGAEIDVKKLVQFFTKFGEIEEGPLGLDKVTGKPRGFCLFVYKTVESAKKALEVPHKNFEGHVLHCQKAVDGPKMGKQGLQYHGQKSNLAPGSVHLMSPPAVASSQPAAAAAGLNPVIREALTAILASQGPSGLANILASAGQVANQGLPGPPGNAGVRGGYGGIGGFGGQGSVQGGYGGQMGLGRGQQGYGHQGYGGQQGYGHAGGGAPYMGHH